MESQPTKSLKRFPLTILAMACSLALAGCSVIQTGTPEAESFKRTMESMVQTAEGATVERFTLYSPSMDREIRVAVVLPPAYKEDPSRQFPVLYTLHGANAPYDTFANMPKLRAELKDKPFIYTCFDADGVSAYIDSYYPVVTARRDDPDKTKRLSLFTTFFFEEFMPAIDAFYRVDGTRRGLTGFSMGGAGAFHYMLKHPELFNSVSGMSSAFYRTGVEGPLSRRGRLEEKLGSREEFPERYQAFDHFYRLEKLVSEGRTLPPIFLHCGTEDYLLERSREMAAELKKLGVEAEYLETPGAHNWDFWYPASIGIAEFHWKHFTE